MVRQLIVFIRSSKVRGFHQILDFKEVNKPEHLSTDGYFLPLISLFESPFTSSQVLYWV